MPRFKIGGIFSNDKLSQIAAAQKPIIRNAISHDSRLRCTDESDIIYYRKQQKKGNFQSLKVATPRYMDQTAKQVAIQ